MFIIARKGKVCQMSKSKILEALALVGLYPGHEFRIAGSDTVYYIGEKYGIFTKNNDVISNEKLEAVLINPDSIIKRFPVTEKEKEILKALYMLGFIYVARDKNSTTCGYDSLPYKGEEAWDSDGIWLDFIDLPCFNRETDFQFIRWEDEKPFDIKAFLDGEGYES